MVVVSGAVVVEPGEVVVVLGDGGAMVVGDAVVVGDVVSQTEVTSATSGGVGDTECHFQFPSTVFLELPESHSEYRRLHLPATGFTFDIAHPSPMFGPTL